MAVSVTHPTLADGSFSSAGASAWNSEHAVTGLGNAAEKNVGTGVNDVAAGDHLHVGVYEPAGVSSGDITDSTATGRAVLTSADSAAARTAIGAGTSSFSGVYSDLSGKPVLGTAAATAATDYATAAQGTKADSALQPAGNGSALTGLTKTQVGLANVDNTSDASKPVSTATQTALDAKQATLVSATNIKTVNGSTLLGSGDLAVSAADPSYSPGSFTVSTETQRLAPHLIRLTTSQRITIEGTGRLSCLS